MASRSWVALVASTFLAAACSGSSDSLPSGGGDGGGTDGAGSSSSGGSSGGDSGKGDASSSSSGADSGKGDASSSSSGADSGKGDGGSSSSGGADASKDVASDSALDAPVEAPADGPVDSASDVVVVGCPDVRGAYSLTLVEATGCGDLNVAAPQCIRQAITASCDILFVSQPKTGIPAINGDPTLQADGSFTGGALKEGTVNRAACTGTWDASTSTMTVDCGGTGSSQACVVALQRTGPTCP
jgi:hypothetical protein